MKILHLGKFHPMKGGMERAILDIVEGLSNRGDICDLLCISTGQPENITLNKYAHIYSVSSIVRLNSVRISLSMIFVLRKLCNGYDIIHIHCPNPMACLALYLSGYSGKVVLHWHSDILTQKILLKFYRPLQSWLINRADIIIGTSPVYLEESPFLRSVKGKLKVIPLGVDRVVPRQKGVESIKKRYNGKKIVFALGRLVAYKGFRFLIDAAEYLSSEYVVVIGGNGPLYGKLLNHVVEKKLQDKVILLGTVPDGDVNDYYGACNVFCLSSIWKTEAFGMVQIEAMSCGKPVVATDIKGSGVPWVNKHGYSGINVEAENPFALASAIMEITSSETKYNIYASQALQRYNELFTKEHMLNEYRKMYASLLEKA